MEIVGWAMSDSLKLDIAINALTMAIDKRQPPSGFVQHTDRSVQNACEAYRNLLEKYGVVASMSRTGHCLDNAPMESFFGSLKNELVHLTGFKTRTEAKAALFEYIEIFHNWQRLHSSIGYRTPAQARLDMEAKLAAW